MKPDHRERPVATQQYQRNGVDHLAALSHVNATPHELKPDSTKANSTVGGHQLDSIAFRFLECTGILALICAFAEY